MARGTLSELLQEGSYGKKRVAELDCLNFLKELMWGLHILHEKYNLIHRSLSPLNLSLDHNNQLRLTSFASCVPCFDSNSEFAQYCPRTRYPKSGFSLEELM